MAALPIVVIPHPVGQLPAEQVHAMADAALDEILAAVTRSRTELARTYTGRTGRGITAAGAGR